VGLDEGTRSEEGADLGVQGVVIEVGVFGGHHGRHGEVMREGERLQCLCEGGRIWSAGTFLGDDRAPFEMGSWALANQGENAPSWVGDFLGLMSWL
jgi:hypothetical protein